MPYGTGTPPCALASLSNTRIACSNPLTSCFKTEKAVINTAFSVLMVGATRFEHATSWSQTKRSTRLSYAPSTKTIFTLYFFILQVFFYYSHYLIFLHKNNELLVNFTLLLFFERFFDLTFSF